MTDYWKLVLYSLIFSAPVANAQAPAAEQSADGDAARPAPAAAADEQPAQAADTGDGSGGDDKTPTTQLESVEVTGDDIPEITPPNAATIDPDEPGEAGPAVDGAEVLKKMPNMHIQRKGGMAGDPVFRGLGGSRLPITTNGGVPFAGGAMQMDPATSYLSPEEFDEINVTKGPQSVTNGPGMITGSVDYKRNPRRFSEPELRGRAMLGGGSNARLDSSASVTAGMKWGYIKVDANRKKARDYRDGADNKVHSAFKRHQEKVTVGLTPDDDTSLELHYDYSNGWTDYADRMMDGTKFARNAWGARFERRNITDWLRRIKADYTHTSVDHAMDTFSHRQPGGMYHVENPDRHSDILRLEGTLAFGDTRTRVGFDGSRDKYRTRGSMGSNVAEAEQYRKQSRDDDQKLSNWGLFAESTWYAAEDQRLIGGIRHDQTRSHYYQGSEGDEMMSSHGVDEGRTRHYSLTSGFFRLEQDVDDFTYYAGFGVAQRAPDYFERQEYNGWDVDPETNHELDLGFRYDADRLNGSVNFFASHIKDFILIEAYDDDADQARNVNANRVGIEGSVDYEFLPDWQMGTSVSYTYAHNSTDHHALAQTPPFSARSYIGYDNDLVSLKAIMRNVLSQDRYARGQGSVMGLDENSASTFNIFSLQAGWQMNDHLKLNAGIENLFDEHYREFINSGSANVPGYNQSNGKQLYEPGRQFWVNLQAEF